MKKSQYQKPELRKVVLLDVCQPMCVSGTGSLTPLYEDTALDDLDWKN